GQVAVVGRDGTKVTDVPPAMAGFDQRLDTVMGEALKDATLVRRERRRVAGRDCQVYRAAAPLVERLTPFDPHGPDYADECIDEAGLLLEETWFDGGSLLRHRVATEVAERAPDGTT